MRQNGLSAGRARRKSIASPSFFCVTWMRVPSGCLIQCVPFASVDGGESYSAAGNLPLCHLPIWPTQYPRARNCAGKVSLHGVLNISNARFPWRDIHWPVSIVARLTPQIAVVTEL